MLQDPNVERYVSQRLKPLQDQIKELQAEMFKLIVVENNVVLPVVIDSKPNTKEALNAAISAIYFADKSDYLSGLYEVVRRLTGLDEPTEQEIKKIFTELNPK